MRMHDYAAWNFMRMLPLYNHIQCPELYTLLLPYYDLFMVASFAL